MDALQVLPMDALTPVADDPPILSLDALTPLAPDILQPLPTDPAPPAARATPAETPAPARPVAVLQGTAVPAVAPEPPPGFVLRACPSCQAEVKPSSGAFCESCGIKLPKLKSKGGAKAGKKGGGDDVIKCFDCGCKNSGDRTLCRDCGMPLPRRDDN